MDLRISGLGFTVHPDLDLAHALFMAADPRLARTEEAAAGVAWREEAGAARPGAGDGGAARGGRRRRAACGGRGGGGGSSAGGGELGRWSWSGAAAVEDLAGTGSAAWEAEVGAANGGRERRDSRAAARGTAQVRPGGGPAMGPAGLADPAKWVQAAANEEATSGGDARVGHVQPDSFRPAARGDGKVRVLPVILNGGDIYRHRGS